MYILGNVSSNFNLWYVPKNYKAIQNQINSSIPPHVPLSQNIETSNINKYIDFFPYETEIRDISRSISLMRNDLEDKYQLSSDCTICGDFPARIVLHELYQEIDWLEYLEMYDKGFEFPEELEANLKLALRNDYYPFNWDLIDF